jgi:uncharacterized protein (DUF2252 family)
MAFRTVSDLQPTGPREGLTVDPIRRIRSFNAGRDPERLRMKYSAMRASPFGFLRGSCHLFYERLARNGVFKSAPLVWACGDLHLENFGSYKGDNRLVYFDVNDFDDAALAPASWDLVRFLVSLRVGADTLALSSGAAQALCRTFLEAYVSALTSGKACWVERETAQGIVRQLLDGLRERARPRFLDARTIIKRHRRLLRVDGKKALPASEAQRSQIANFMREFAKGQMDPGFYAVLDVARRVAGTGSLGVDRFAILVEGKGSPDGNYLLDLKQALPSSLVPHLKVAQPKWKSEAHRVVALQRRVQAVSMAFLQPVWVGDIPYVLRALQPAEDRVELSGSGRSPGELEQAIGTMGRVVAWAQLRSAGRDGSAIADELIEFARRKKWQDALLDAARDGATQVRKDGASFDAAYDDGAFDG